MVKFYMPDPSQLEEEYTRYLAALQVSKTVYLDPSGSELIFRIIHVI